MLKWYSLFTIRYERTTYTIQCMCPKRWANEREIYVVVCWIAKFIFHNKKNRICQFEYKSTPTIAVYVYFHFFMLFCFRSLFLRFVSLPLSVLFVVIVFVRSHFCNLISRLRLAIIVHSYVQHSHMPYSMYIVRSLIGNWLAKWSVFDVYLSICH